MPESSQGHHRGCRSTMHPCSSAHSHLSLKPANAYVGAAHPTGCVMLRPKPLPSAPIGTRGLRAGGLREGGFTLRQLRALWGNGATDARLAAGAFFWWWLEPCNAASSRASRAASRCCAFCFRRRASSLRVASAAFSASEDRRGTKGGRQATQGEGAGEKPRVQCSAE